MGHFVRSQVSEDRGSGNLAVIVFSYAFLNDNISLCWICMQRIYLSILNADSESEVIQTVILEMFAIILPKIQPKRYRRHCNVWPIELMNRVENSSNIYFIWRQQITEKVGDQIAKSLSAALSQRKEMILPLLKSIFVRNAHHLI